MARNLFYRVLDHYRMMAPFLLSVLPIQFRMMQFIPFSFRGKCKYAQKRKDYKENRKNCSLSVHRVNRSGVGLRHK